MQCVVKQLIIYALIGLLTNGSAYMIYLLLTHWGVSSKLAVTLLYSTGSLIGFLGNRRLTFNHTGNLRAIYIRYSVVQILGYLLNLALLVCLVDWYGFSHQYVQAIAVVIVACFIFASLKLAVFKK
ncbi:GtrA family protein [Legionella genomosp. 1]|uniref:GtrA family protein n=1 Tax=Legionella genomosp. 1 TaxID=1093625 RepID=UPI003967A21B